MLSDKLVALIVNAPFVIGLIWFFRYRAKEDKYLFDYIEKCGDLSYFEFYRMYDLGSERHKKLIAERDEAAKKYYNFIGKPVPKEHNPLSIFGL